MYFETSKRRGILSTLTCGLCWRWQAEINSCTFMFWGSQGPPKAVKQMMMMMMMMTTMTYAFTNYLNIYSAIAYSHLTNCSFLFVSMTAAVRPL